MPPKWTFGYWQSKISYKSAEETLEIARQMRAAEVPCDVIHLDTHWFKEDWYCDLEFDTGASPTRPVTWPSWAARHQGLPLAAAVHPGRLAALQRPQGGRRLRQDTHRRNLRRRDLLDARLQGRRRMHRLHQPGGPRVHGRYFRRLFRSGPGDQDRLRRARAAGRRVSRRHARPPHAQPLPAALQPGARRGDQRGDRRRRRLGALGLGRQPALPVALGR